MVLGVEFGGFRLMMAGQIIELFYRIV